MFAVAMSVVDDYYTLDLLMLPSWAIKEKVVLVTYSLPKLDSYRR